jgi:diaminopropionate ammonia-lyase
VPPIRDRSAARGLFTNDEYQSVRDFFAARPELAPTPTRRLGALAGTLGLGALLAKDETARFGLNAFKLLGARFAVEHLIARGVVRRGATLTCASEGNHGRAVARAARDAGCAARVYMAADAAEARASAIAQEGADVIRIAGSYDDAVRQVERESAQHGWTVISDTAWPGYEEIPRLIMLGYTRMMAEVEDEVGAVCPDAIFVQGGVGGLLCGVASWWAFHYGQDRPRIVCVEPLQAACLLASARAGRPVAVAGPLETTLAGLRNREVSPLAFEAILPIVDAYVAIDDAWAHQAMRRLGRPGGDDATIDAGASGAAALGGLLAVLEDPALADVRDRLLLGINSRVLVVVSEGITDPLVSQAVMEGA